MANNNRSATTSKYDSEDEDWEPIRIAKFFRKDKEISDLDISLKSCSNDIERVKAFKTFGEIPEFQAKLKKSDDITSRMIEITRMNFEAGNYEKVLKGYTHAIMFSPAKSNNLAQAFSARSDFFMYSKEWKLALLDIKSAIECYPPSDVRRKYEKNESYIEKQLKEGNEANHRLGQMNLKTENVNVWRNYVEKEIFKIENPNSKIPSAAGFVEIQTDVERGRKLITTSDIPIGTIVVVEEPFVKLRKSGLTKDLDRDRCHFCLATTKRLIPCPTCVFALYCDEKCLEEAYKKYHHFECRCLSYLNELNTSSGYGLVFRLLCTVGPEELYNIFTGKNLKFREENPSTSFVKGCDPDSGIYDSGSYLPIYHLHSKQSSLVQTDDFSIVMSCVLMVTLLDKYTNFFDNIEYSDNWTRFDFVHFTVSIAVRHVNSLSCNAFALRSLKKDFENDNLGNARFAPHAVGAFAVGSLFNHSCTPNVIRVNDSKGKLAFVTVKPLKDGEELLISYVPHFYNNSLQKRQPSLKDAYEFNCKCEACVGDWPLLKILDDLDPNLCCSNCAKDFPTSKKSSKAFGKCKLPITVPSTRCKNCGALHNIQKILEKINKRSEEAIRAQTLVLSRRPLEALPIIMENLKFFHSSACEPFVLICQATTWYQFALFFVINFGN